MSNPAKEIQIPKLRSLRVAAARLHQVIGWAGITGLVLCVLAAWISATTWQERPLQAEIFAAVPAKPRSTPIDRAAGVATPASEPTSASNVALPPVSEIPLLLTQLKQLAVTNKLAWTAADYRLVPGTETKPQTMEVVTTFKAPYPNIRAFVTRVLQDVPAATVREFSLIRQSTEAPDVEAKITIGVLLDDGPPSRKLAGRRMP